MISQVCLSVDFRFLQTRPKFAVWGGFRSHGVVPRLCCIQRDTRRFSALQAAFFSYPHRFAELLPGETLVFVKGMTVDVQCCTGLGVTQQARHRSDIHALGDEHAGIGVAQTVHIQIFWQTVLTKYFFEAEGEGTGHHRVAIRLSEQVVILCERTSALLLLFPLTFLLPGPQQFAQLLR